MDDDTIMPASRFGELPWHELDPDRFGRDWSVSRGGYGFDPQTYAVKTYRDGPKPGAIDMTVWEAPPAFSAMIQVIEKWAGDRALRKVRDALGITLGSIV